MFCRKFFSPPGLQSLRQSGELDRIKNKWTPSERTATKASAAAAASFFVPGLRQTAALLWAYAAAAAACAAVLSAEVATRADWGRAGKRWWAAVAERAW